MLFKKIGIFIGLLMVFASAFIDSGLSASNAYDDDFEYATRQDRYRKTKETEILRMVREATSVLHRENLDILKRIESIEAELEKIKSRLDRLKK